MKNSSNHSSKHLGTYLTLALGAGVVGSHEAQAAIVDIDVSSISGTNAGLAVGTSASFQVTPNGSLRLWNQGRYNTGGGGSWGVTGVTPDKTGFNGAAAGTALVGYTTTPSRNLAVFAEGEKIGIRTTYRAGYNLDLGKYGSKYIPSSNDPTSSFTNHVNYTVQKLTYPGGSSQMAAFSGFIGFRDTAGSYGWLQQTWNGSDTFQITAGAYNDVPGADIFAGQTSASTVVPEPSALALLALGATGLLAARRRTDKAA
jgi:hypothetical protein